MPGGDRTGPFGAGPVTGRGAGFCAGYNMPGYMNARGGRGFGTGRGRGMGMGRGHRYMYYATGQPGWMRGAAGWGMFPAGPQAATAGFSQRDELRYLKNQAGQMNEMLAEINQRIDELEKSKENKGDM